MKKDRIILKTHGVNSSEEVDLIVLPKKFYIKVNIENCGDFDVELRDDNNEQLFSVCHRINGVVNGTPVPEVVADTEKKMAGYIADSFADFLLYDINPTFDTEANLDKWAGWASHAFYGCEVEWNHKNEE